MEQLFRDIRFGVRTLLKNRGFAMLAILTLGLGIGANTAIFSVIDGVLLKPLPYANGNRLVLVRQSAPLAGRSNTGVSIKELYDYREQTQAFDALVEYHQMNFDLLKRGEPDRVNAGVVSHDFFDVLGITPILGRAFVADDDKPGADAVLILSYSYWQTKFGGDPRIVGEVFEMNDRPHTVVGVLPNVPHYPQENDVYMSVSACPFRAAAEKRIDQNRRVFSGLTVFGRLKAGVPRERASADVETICGHFTRDNPTAYRPGSGFTATTLPVRDELTRNARPMLLILLATTGLILLIACANVANLTLARLLRRDRELAVRAAMGAARGRLVRQLLTESTILSLAGGLVGLAFASSTISLLTAFVGRFTSRTGEIGIDPWVLGFTLLVSIITGVVFGTLPALSSRVDLVSAMKQGGRGSSEGVGRKRVQDVLIVAQVAVSVVLLIGAGLLMSSFYRLQRVDPGYHAERVLSAEAFTNFSKYPDAESQLRFYEPVLQRLQAEPGVVAVAVTNAVPLGASTPNTTPFEIQGRKTDDPDKRPSADVRVVTPNYFQTLGIPLVEGRAFNDLDRRDAKAVAIINKAMVRFWDKSDPIGSQVSFDSGQTWARVVGIVGDVKQFGLDQDTTAQVYTPLSQSQGLAGRFLVRTNGDPLSAAKMIREDVHAVDPNMPVENIKTLDELRDRYLATPKLTATLLAVFAGLALLVTMSGISGVIATSVSQRTQEFGVRMALGASRDRVLALVLQQGLALVIAGLAVGVAASIALTRLLSTYLFDTTPTDPITFMAVCLLFLVAGALACLGPAWRATRVDPMLALRAD
ncbi:MAG TPA: ABC transporter permease [Vicinamibacterales bacterium]|jgi:putative ABC transport system permease protein|nr:ABC transporter permease [Vicinamibacterales bacterium]